MKRSEMETELFCTQCMDHTLHQISYLNEKISKIECEQCHHVVKLRLDVKKEFLKESYYKAVSKPGQIRRELKEGKGDFLIHFPARVVTKPYRLVKYLNESWKVVKASRTEQDQKK
ncbi:bh protein [Gracilibacillus alcaliphilus]|uniref:bh protein n=1 Tax=Gracilibacillus alcaliphilus TaxID=1401441 RepID=UPI0019599B83|nr:bh protein [Gracilibacillus alcaliphilus]MBM7676248.1 hypothetical protein [Gracilibacillus alcaliphilus]